MSESPSHDSRHFDLCVVGGGINGAGIARDAAGRGLSVLLVEKDDLAQGTSSRSGKLIHGGLRYLEYYEFRLVRHALIEREVLLEAAPHIIWPMRFVLPHSPDDRPAWLVRLGLLLYDHLGGRKRLPPTRSLDLATDPEGSPIKPEYRRAFEYSDCWVDDARLVVLNVVDAVERGATVMTRTTCRAARRDGDAWRIALERGHNRQPLTVTAGAMVNAAGPWVDTIIDGVSDVNAKRRIRLVKGSHIVVNKFWEGSQAYLIQHTDKRVIFINPYEDDKALIGTTDIPYEGDPSDVCVDAAEIEYLIAAVNRYFQQPLTTSDVLHSFSGVRPLFDDDADNPSAVTRDYLFDLDNAAGRCPLLSIYGGKITTYRKLAEQAIDKLAAQLPVKGRAWTAYAPLPGGDMDNADFTRFESELQAHYAELPVDVVHHYARLYGTRAKQLLGSATVTEDLGLHFGGVLYEREVHYLVEHEWAQTAADILSRRTKHELHLSATQQSEFSDWFNTLSVDSRIRATAVDQP